MSVDLKNPDKTKIKETFQNMSKLIPASIRDSIGRKINLLSEPEFELATIESLNESPEATGQELEKAITRKIENRRSRFANSATHGTSEFWVKVREQSADEARRILSGHTSEVLGIDALRSQAADLMSQADTKQAELSRMDSELKRLPKQIQSVTGQLAQIESQRSSLDKKRLEEQFESIYLRSILSTDIIENLKATQDTALWSGLVATLPLRLKALDKAEAKLQAELVKLTERQSDLEAQLG
jgi:prefoldin subunit 5